MAVTTGISSKMKFGRTTGSVAEDAEDDTSNVTVPDSCSGASQKSKEEDTL